MSPIKLDGLFNFTSLHNADLIISTLKIRVAMTEMRSAKKREIGNEMPDSTVSKLGCKTKSGTKCKRSLGIIGQWNSGNELT